MLVYESLTVEQILDRQPHALVKSSGIRGRLEGEAELLVARLPVVERGHDLVVLEVLLDGAAQNHLK